MKKLREHIFGDVGDWRTLGLIVLTYTIAVLIFFGAGQIPVWFGFFILIPLTAFHSSLQHECIHGHPFKWQLINDLIVSIPLSPFVPYFRYKETHLGHHLDANLCDPYDDPESWYQDPQFWAGRSKVAKVVFNFNNSLMGRILIGPIIGLVSFVIWDVRLMSRGRLDVLAAWVLHLSALSVLLWLMAGVFPVYAFLMAGYFGMSFVLIRSFAEHTAHEMSRARSAVVEGRGFFAFLFLNNNFHTVHHSHPRVAWYRIPALYQENKKRFLEMNMDYRFSGYGELFRAYLFRQKETVPLPETQQLSSRPLNPPTIVETAEADA